MDFIDKIKDFSERIVKLDSQIKTEEATKNAFIMPFIQILGYDVFNPNELVPEFTADIGIKKGEKVDYAIIIDNKPIILIECKCCGENLDKHNSQLYRYFSVTKSKFAILTDGIIYKFFTDLEEPNKLDEKPFFIFNILNFDDNQVSELKKFHKSSFNMDIILSTAEELKYTREIKNILIKEYNNPSESFARFFISKIQDKRITQAILDKFLPITRKAFIQFINDLLNEKLKSVISDDIKNEIIIEETKNNDLDDSKTKIITTEEELESFYTIKAILRNIVDTKRIHYRDNASYFNILLDNNKLKTICRLYFNSKQKYIGLFNDEKEENKYPIDSIDNIYNYTDIIVNRLNLLNK